MIFSAFGCAAVSFTIHVVEIIDSGKQITKSAFYE
jgi:hypothetical protein